MFGLLSRLIGMTSLNFGGADPAIGHPWYHESLTKEASSQAGWQATLEEEEWERPGDEIAWHADYVDSYLYNPLWIVRGDMPRIKATLSTTRELEKLHFDDLFSTQQVTHTWRRYMSGAIAGLIWAGERNDIVAARNIVGASLHAIQDFYSHSNWMDDPSRRNTTWFQTPRRERERLSLWTGSYEHQHPHGIKPHGTWSIWCALLRNLPGRLLDGLCHATSPLSNSGLCRHWRECREGQAAHPPTIAGVPLPVNIMYYAPPGIALDSPWMAEIGVTQRGLDQGPAALTGQDAFDIAYRLARQASVDWLRYLDVVMPGLSLGSFWAEVKTRPIRGRREREQQYEKFDRFPYMFMTVGDYPPSTDEAENGWFLRVRIETDAETGSGTNADIYAEAGGRRFLLDYMPEYNPIIEYDNFEPGDQEAYYIGPFSSMPDTLTLINDSATGTEVVTALGRDFLDAIDAFFEGVQDSLLSIVAGQADFVEKNKQLWSPNELASIGDSWQAFEIVVNGRSEGHYRVDGRIRRVAAGRDGDLPWSEYEVRLDNLHCIKESEFDRFSSTDEPFLLALLINQGSQHVQSFRTEPPFRGVNTGSDRRIGHTFGRERLYDGINYLTLPVQIFEHDDENRTARSRLYTEFARKAEEETAAARRDFATALGASIGAAWKIHRIEVFAFTRGHQVTAGTVLDQVVDGWVAGAREGRITFPLSFRREWNARVTPESLIHIWQTAPNNGWSEMEGLPGGPAGGSPVVSQNADGRLEVFVRGPDNALWHLWQTAPNGTWSTWASLGGTMSGQPAVGRNADGRLEVFVRGPDNALWHLWQTAPNGTWSTWASLAGQLLWHPEVGRNEDGRLEVFAVGAGQALWHTWQTTTNGTWSTWASLGGVVTGQPNVAENADGRLEVFALGFDNALWHVSQTAPNSGWSSMASLGGNLLGCAVGRIADGRLQVFARGADNVLRHISQTAANAESWSSWASLGASVNDVAVAENADGRLEVFASRVADNALWHIWQTAPNSGWSSGASLGGALAPQGRPGVGRNADGRLEVFARAE